MTTFKAAGIVPISLGSMNQWPAQFWFDYLILRTAGAEYRAKLMAGEAAYTDPEVVRAMELWAELVDAGCFADGRQRASTGPTPPTSWPTVRRP